jgi:hypothetical protein
LKRINAVPWLYVVAWPRGDLCRHADCVAGSAALEARMNVPRAAIQVMCVLGLLMLFGMLRTANPSRLADVSVPVTILGSWLVSVVAGDVRRQPRSTQILAAIVVGTVVCFSAGAVVVVADAAHQARVRGFPVDEETFVTQSVTVWRQLGALPANLEWHRRRICSALQTTCAVAPRRPIACSSPTNLPEVYYFAERGFAAGQRRVLLELLLVDGFPADGGQSLEAAISADRLDCTGPAPSKQEFANDYPVLTAYLRAHYRRAGTLTVEAGRPMDVWVESAFGS